MRVRIGRFRGLRKAIEKSRKTERVKSKRWVGALQRRAMRQVPRAVRTARRLCGEILIDPKLPELRVSRCASFPLLPDHGTQTMPYPLIQSFQQRGSLTETEVSKR
jgi:hypothetical protein